jgi:hypothetical protein
MCVGNAALPAALLGQHARTHSWCVLSARIRTPHQPHVNTLLQQEKRACFLLILTALPPFLNG